MLYLTESNFLSESKKYKYLLVDFYSELCGPCIIMNETLDILNSKIKSNKLQIAKANIDDNPKLEKIFKIISTPTLIVVKDGTMVGRHEGKMTVDETMNFVLSSLKR